MTAIEPEEVLPPVAHVALVYNGPVAPHWEMQVRYGDQKMLDEFWTRVCARLLLLPKHDPQFRRNRERVNRDAERELIICDWDLGEGDAESVITEVVPPLIADEFEESVEEHAEAVDAVSVEADAVSVEADAVSVEADAVSVEADAVSVEADAVSVVAEVDSELIDAADDEPVEVAGGDESAADPADEAVGEADDVVGEADDVVEPASDLA